MAEGAALSRGGAGPPSRRSSLPGSPAARSSVLLAGCALAGLAATLLWPPPVLFVWNASASAPIGLYRVHGGDRIRRGDMVVAWAPPQARRLSANRHYLPANVPLVKRIAAVGGDRVCAAGRSVTVNGRRAASRRRLDPRGRPLPWWTGCRILGSGDTFLLGSSPQSFDGRYFGITRRTALVGRAVLLWATAGKGLSHG